MKFRRAKINEAKILLEMQKEEGDDFYVLKDHKDSIKDKDTIFIVAENKGEIAGYILGCINLVKRNEVSLQETRVLKKYRGKGLGKRLNKEFFKECKKRKVNLVFTTIDKEHIPFYVKSLGFNISKDLAVSKEL